MEEPFKTDIVRSDRLPPDLLTAIHALCHRAYEEDLEYLFSTFTQATHVLGFLGEKLVSHAMWVTRWLQLEAGPRLRTAYVEMVATEPRVQRRGFASAVMQTLARAIIDFELGALCPAAPDLYARLGWIFWRGPLFIRTPEGLTPTLEERIMILKLPKTPALDLDSPLSAEWREGEVW